MPSWRPYVLATSCRGAGTQVGFCRPHGNCGLLLVMALCPEPPKETGEYNK